MKKNFTISGELISSFSSFNFFSILREILQKITAAFSTVCD